MAQSVKNLVQGLSKKEKRLLMIMGGVFVAMVIFLFVFFVQGGITDLEEEGDGFAKALALIDEEETNFLGAKARNTAALGLGRVKPTPLRTLVDKIAKQLNVTPPDVKELAEQHHGTSWIENSVELSLRQIGLISLTRFMEEVKGHGKKFPIAITKLEIRKLRRTQDSYNVKMVVSTYEQLPDQRPLGKGGNVDSRKGGGQ